MITPADFIDSLLWIAREWCTRFVYTPSTGPVEEARGRRGLRQTSWEAQLPVDHADPTDRTIFVTFLPTEEKGKKVDKQMDTKRQRETVKIPPKAICQTIKMIPAEL
ncbi:hypothetical protein PV328_001245 [Microctonus aethiopoides]|uniref:Uncharacterized protein n=1 Tax=Microctonus aethiopoides TaxID=144406 RepID=A0AA39FX57_9HYME|nr:hypothetical protein PV328_001245 [Microctonus aethiopoides]